MEKELLRESKFLKYCIVTYGCQMNAHESEKLAGILERAGYERAELADCDLAVFNTCCIRENAERKAEGHIGALKKWKRDRPGRRIAVVGCMTQQEGRGVRLVEKFPFIDVVLGTHNAYDLLSRLEASPHRRSLVEIREEGVPEEDCPIRREGKVSALVNIMYGCNNFCTYCIVPVVRGREVSRSPEGVEREVRGLLAEGYRDITLLGQNVNSYRGRDADGREVDFPALLARLAQLPGRFRLRFMTSHPKDFTEELARTMARYDNIAKCVHLPAQSGSSAVLRRMNRKYTREDYINALATLRRHLPQAAVTTDLMVGFPGESDADFEQTLSLVQEAGFAAAFTFVYSRRRGTKADAYPDQISAAVKKERIMRLVALQNELTAKDSAAYLGRTCEVLCEGLDDAEEHYYGRTESNKLVLFDGKPEDVGAFVRVRIEAAGATQLRGTKE